MAFGGLVEGRCGVGGSFGGVQTEGKLDAEEKPTTNMTGFIVKNLIRDIRFSLHLHRFVGGDTWADCHRKIVFIRDGGKWARIFWQMRPNWRDTWIFPTKVLPAIRARYSTGNSGYFLRWLWRKRGGITPKNICRMLWFDVKESSRNVVAVIRSLRHSTADLTEAALSRISFAVTHPKMALASDEEITNRKLAERFAEGNKQSAQ